MASLLTDAVLLVTLSMLVLPAACRNEHAGLQEELLTRIQSLETQGREQAEKMQKMELQIEAQNERLASQEATITEYKERVRDLERAVVGEQSSNRHDVSESKNGGNEEADSDKHVQPKASVPWQGEIGSRLRVTSTGKHKHGDRNQAGPLQKIPEKQTAKSAEDLMTRKDGIKDSDALNAGAGKELRQRRWLNDGEHVSFHALIDSASEVANLNVGQSIVFPLILNNAGSGYHNGTGTFIAPISGIHMFSVSITTYNKNQNGVVVAIVHNGNLLGGALAHGDDNHQDQGSLTVIRYVAAGDEVWVRLQAPADASIWGGALTSFTGCLIHAF